ncbi:MAG TPA: hypothetical protein VG101_08070 [Puia sp.]|jgi:hypothetical protein|nr:hypothetical protein [Puia sp.]
MNKIRVVIFALLICCGCHHPRTLQESLTIIFSDHLRQIDTAAMLDSLHVRWNIPVTEKMGRIFDDSIYVREYSRIKGQLAGALITGDKDSIEFFQYEIRYMEKEIDSIGHAIGESDSSHRYGSLVGCAYYISGNMKKMMDSTIVFIDTTSTLRFTDFMDSALRRTDKMLR